MRLTKNDGLEDGLEADHVVVGERGDDPGVEDDELVGDVGVGGEPHEDVAGMEVAVDEVVRENLKNGNN